MYIANLKNKKAERKEDQTEEFFSKKEKVFENEEMPAEEVVDKSYLNNALMHWQAPEHEIVEKDKKWYLYAGLVLSAIVAFAIYSNSPVMAITFILIGVVGYIFLNKEPRIVDFAITQDGIIASRDIYEFDNMHSFWIFYEPGQKKVISLHMKNKIMPHVHIPVHDEDPVEIRKILMEYIPEIKQEQSPIDIFERLLGI